MGIQQHIEYAPTIGRAYAREHTQNLPGILTGSRRSDKASEAFD